MFKHNMLCGNMTHLSAVGNKPPVTQKRKILLSYFSGQVVYNVVGTLAYLQTVTYWTQRV